MLPQTDRRPAVRAVANKEPTTTPPRNLFLLLAPADFPLHLKLGTVPDLCEEPLSSEADDVQLRARRHQRANAFSTYASLEAKCSVRSEVV